MQKFVEMLIGRLATDPELRRRFAEDPHRLLAELTEQGIELNEVERRALSATDPGALEQLADSLDRRLIRARAEGQGTRGLVPNATTDTAPVERRAIPEE